MANKQLSQLEKIGIICGVIGTFIALLTFIFDACSKTPAVTNNYSSKVSNNLIEEPSNNNKKKNSRSEETVQQTRQKNSPKEDVDQKDYSVEMNIENAGDYINKTATKSDVAILIVDQNNNFHNSLSVKIADLYRGKNQSVITSLFTTQLINSKYLKELESANLEIINLLSLQSYTNYLVIGRYTSSFRNGTYTVYICDGTLDVRVISCYSKSQVDGFTVSAINGYDDKLHAENGAIEKLVETVRKNHLNL